MQDWIFQASYGPSADALAKAIIHSFWQAPLVLILLYAGSAGKKKREAHHRYNLYVAGMMLIALVSFFTFGFYLISSYIVPAHLTLSQDPIAIWTPETSKVGEHSMAPFLNWNVFQSQWILLSWYSGVAILTLRMLGGWLTLYRLKLSYNRVVPSRVLALAGKIQSRFGIAKDVTIAMSSKIDVPITYGHFKPIIVLPLAVINQLSYKETEIILAHEMAHILRNDFLINLLMTTIEILMFYHPVVWFLTKQIRTEMEHCCDDLTVKLYPNRLDYARSLLKLQTIGTAPNGGIAMALFTQKKSLMKRIQRLFRNEPDSEYPKTPIIAGVILLVALVAMGAGQRWSGESLQKDALQTDNPSSMIETVSDLLPSGYLSNMSEESLIPARALLSGKESKEDDSRQLESISNSQPLAQLPKTSHSLLSLESPLNLIPDTIDEEEFRAQKEAVRAEMKALRDKQRALAREIREKAREMRMTQREELKAHRDKLRQEREKLNKMRSEMTDEQRTRWKEKNKERIKEWKNEFKQKFKDKDWKNFDGLAIEENMLELQERIHELIDEEWLDEVTALGAEMDAVLESRFNEEWALELDRLQDNIHDAFGPEWQAKMERFGEDLSQSLQGWTFDFDDMDFDIGDFSFDFSKKRLVNLKADLLSAMTRDGLLQEDSFTMELSQESMTVDGKPMDRITADRYRDLVETHLSGAFSDSNATMIRISKSANEEAKLSISLDRD